MLPGDVPARREADERHLRAAGVLHRNLLLRRLRRPPHKDQQASFQHFLRIERGNEARGLKLKCGGLVVRYHR